MTAVSVPDSLFVVKSAKQLWLEHEYDGDLPTDIKAWIAGGMSWKAMSKLVSARCHHPVSYESLRVWYRAEAEEVAKAMKATKAKANTPLGFDVPAKQSA